MIVETYKRKYWLPIEFNKEGRYEDNEKVQQRKLANANAIPEPPAPPKGNASKQYFRRKRLTEVLLKSAKCSQCNDINLVDVFPVIRLEPCGHLCCPRCVLEKFQSDSEGCQKSIVDLGEGIIGVKKSLNDRYWIINNSDEFDSLIRADVNDAVCTGCQNNKTQSDLISRVCIAQYSDSLFMCFRCSHSIKVKEEQPEEKPSSVVDEQSIDELDRKVESMSDDEEEYDTTTMNPLLISSTGIQEDGTTNGNVVGVSNDHRTKDGISDEEEYDESSECDVHNVCLKTFSGSDVMYEHVHQFHKRLPYDQPIIRAQRARDKIMRYEARKNQFEAESTASRSALEGIKVLSPPPVPPPPPPSSNPSTLRLPSPISNNPLIPPPPSSNPSTLRLPSPIS